MRHGQRTAIYDSVLRIEAYRFKDIVQPFPRHFHEQYVIGIVERGQRTLSCKNTVRSIGRGDVVWFHPGDDHACAQRSEEPFDYLGFHIPQNVMLELAEEITGGGCFPGSLLEKGVSPIEAALRTGFSDQSHFTNAFSSVIGLAPGAYRAMLQAK